MRTGGGCLCLFFFFVVVFFLNLIYSISISCWQFLYNVVVFGVLDLLKDLRFLLLHSVGLIILHFFIFQSFFTIIRKKENFNPVLKT